MARMLPDIQAADIPNIGEREVFRALKKQLPDDYVVRFHYPACWTDGSYLKDCEVDFIIIAPSRGLMFLEVKSSHGFDCEGAQWYRIKPNGNREPARDPFDQVMGTKHRVVERISKRKFNKEKRDFPGIFGHMVIYPRGKVIGKMPEAYDSRMIVTRNGMPTLSEQIEDTFKLSGPPSKASQFTGHAMREVTEFFEDNCRFIQVMAADIDEDERNIEELTRHQYNAFRHLLSIPRVVVSGPAGSGKTMIAQWVASEYARKGKRVLLLCYNRVLEKWIRDHLLGYEVPNLDVRSFFSLCREWVMKSGLPFNPSGQQDFWISQAPNMFSEALDGFSDEEKYDVVIVDEAQDFHADWWMPVQLLLRDPDNGCLFLFRDPEQAGVYGHGTSYPNYNIYDVALRENCRNTVMINDYCSEVVEYSIPSFESSPQGTCPEISAAYEEHGHRSLAVKKAVVTLLDEGFNPSQIAVLSPFSPRHANSSLSRIESIGTYPLKGGEDVIEKWLGDEFIWGSTIKTFKGLEADCVIIADFYGVSESFTKSDLYVACSRAKHKLLIIPMNHDSAEYLHEMLPDEGQDVSMGK